MVRRATAKKMTAVCKTFRHDLEGPVYQETVSGVVRWVAYLSCGKCGTLRRDVMTVGTCELVSRTYSHPEDYDTLMDVSEARKMVFKSLLRPGSYVGGD